ncbi:MAG: glycosyltransferase [Eubacterium sp.]|nr:glycosyltransferase [Eubacterium sp.]
MNTLSFVVCAYKESPYLRDCIRSLLAQKVSCPVYISTSTPNRYIENIAGEFSLPLILQDHAPGIAEDWNSAYAAADSAYTVLAHQDDLYEPEYAEAALAALGRASHPLIFFTDYYEIRNGRKVTDTKNLRIKRRLLRPLAKHGAGASVSTKRRILSLGNPVCCPSVTYVRANLPPEPFLTGMGSNLDWEAWERFSRMEGSFEYDARMLVGHRIHTASTTSALIGSSRRTTEDLDMLKKFWPAPVASAINCIYKRAEASNTVDAS